MAKKINKEELNRPDAFVSVSDKVAKFLGDNLKAIFALFGLGAIVGIGFVVMDHLNKSKELNAQEALFEVTAQVKKIELDGKSQEEKALEDVKKQLGMDNFNLPDEKAKSPEDLSKSYGSALSSYERVIADHSGTKASFIAAIDAADLCIQHKAWDQAQKFIGMVVNQPKRKDFFFGLLNAQMGTILNSQGKFDEALTHFSKVLDSKEQEFLHPEVLVKMGLSHEKKGEVDQARAMYERASEEFSSTTAGKRAKSFLRLLELKGKGNQG